MCVPPASLWREKTMSDIPRYTLRLGNHGSISQEPDAAGPYVRWDDHQAEVEGLKVLVRAKQTMTEKVWTDAQKSVERLEAEIKRLTSERDLAQTHLKHLFDERHSHASLDNSRSSDEDIWREAFMAAMERGGVFDHTKVADLALAEYRKRWPR